jgi:hypothetical protein
MTKPPEICESPKVIILDTDCVSPLVRERLLGLTALILAFVFLSVGSPRIVAQPVNSIPETATILEEQIVTKHRKLVLWMQDPSKHPSELGPDDIYTCPDQTRGSYYSGRANVSLVNTSNTLVINTLEIKGVDIDGPNTEVDLPYMIRAGYYYSVPGGSSNVERKPRIMSLKDYNGDRFSHEFALFNAEACMGRDTTLIGYSIRRDKVIQYPITISDAEGKRTVYWLDYLFSKKPISAGRWRYDIDYRGRGGTLDRFEVRFNDQNESFTATIRRER